VTFAACGVTDPRLDDLRLQGTVTDLAGVAIPGAQVQLIRLCPAPSCTPRTRGQAVTGAEGGFEILLPRESDEESSWDLVCHEFTVNISAVGYEPIRGSYQAWRGPFCASGEAANIDFRLTPGVG
jgi:hypothetical protein